MKAGSTIQVKSYTRKTKSGKSYTVKGYTRKHTPKGMKGKPVEASSANPNKPAPGAEFEQKKQQRVLTTEEKARIAEFDKAAMEADALRQKYPGKTWSQIQALEAKRKAAEAMAKKKPVRKKGELHPKVKNFFDRVNARLDRRLARIDRKMEKYK